MPDLATVEASTPKCPVAKKRKDATDGVPCGNLLEWDHTHDRWRCPKHRSVLTPAQLVALQAPVAA